MLRVPDDADTAVITLPDHSAQLLQIVPTITGISKGGSGRPVVLFGSGFIEGGSTVRFGSIEVADQGPGAGDGLDIDFAGIPNGQIRAVVPTGGSLPYEVITAGGSSARVGDVSRVVSVSATGTPARVKEPSANVSQTVRVEGSRFTAGVTKVVLEIVEASAGTASILTVTPESVAEDGRSLVFKVPPDAHTGVISTLGAGAGERLQIVPTVTGIFGGPGRFTAIFGTGFIEGFTTVRLGEVRVVDGGPGGNDGLDIDSGAVPNGKITLAVPVNGTLPYEVITEGGSSGRSTDVTGMTATAGQGTPANPSMASANAGQLVMLRGNGLGLSPTQVVLETVDSSSGEAAVHSATPVSVANDGTSLIFKVPDDARTGLVSILGAGSGALLQIVPTLGSVSTATAGQTAVLFGSGFIEGGTTVQFGGVRVMDRGPGSNDGLDVDSGGVANGKIVLVVPAGGGTPVTVITAGGVSNPVTP